MKLSDLIAPTTGTKFAKLRDAQKEALRLYADGAHKDTDLAIELPTGAGKTLIALLVLEYWRGLGKRVAILTGNKVLARQLEGEAHDLGTPTVRFEGRAVQFVPRDLRAYSRCQAIGVMNYWVYINQNPAVEPADYLVLDDAQLAEGALLSLYSARIGRREHGELFAEAMKLIAQYSDSQVADDMVKGIEAGPWGPTDLVPFSAQFEMWEEFEALLSMKIAEAPEDLDWKDLSFRWTRIRPKGRQSLLLISADEIVLRPYIFPMQDFGPLATLSQRIYMSATLHDPEDLRRRLGTPTIRKLDIPAEVSKEEDGRRLFVFNQTASPTSKAKPSDEVLAPVRELLKLLGKSVWLCSSGQEAAHWQDWIKKQLGAKTSTWLLTSTGDELDTFSSANEGHLFIGGRFEGMDFPDDICRLAVLPSLPIATGALERFTTEQLKDASFQRTRMLERIKQAIGRCTRGKNDYAIYYFLDTRFLAEMESKTFGALLSDTTRRQVEIGLELTQDGMGAVVPFATKFLNGNFADFDAREKKARPPALSARSAPAMSASVTSEVNGWRSLFERRDFASAAEQFEKAQTALKDAEREHRAFWIYQQAFAEHLRYRLDEEKEALGRCINLLRRTLEEGGSASWFNRLRRAYNKLGGAAIAVPSEHEAILDRWDEFVETYPYFKGRFLKWQARLKEFLDGTHSQVCEALEIVGGLLGFTATRPPGDGAPDGLWLARDHAVTLEAKIEVDRDLIVLADVNQADGHRRTALGKLGVDDSQLASVIVTGLERIDKAAKDAIGTIRILPLEMVADLQARLEVVMRNYWKGWSRDDAGKRKALRAAASKAMPAPGWLLRAIQRAKGPVIRADDFFSEWP